MVNLWILKMYWTESKTFPYVVVVFLHICLSLFNSVGILHNGISSNEWRLLGSHCHVPYEQAGHDGKR